MPSSTVENYLKHLYLSQPRDSADLVPMGHLASTMSVAPGTATAMVKTLADAGLVDYEPRSGARLTSAGTKLALAVLRRHRLIELFLVKTLGLDWSEVHEEAEELEHAVSDKVLKKMDNLLGHPRVDPHGDPIPTATGTVTLTDQPSLVDCTAGRPVQIARVLDQDPHFLQFVDRSGLTPGTGVVVESRDTDADAVTIQPNAYPPITIGNLAASKILVEENHGG